jgi:uncharacterized membrane protein
MRHVLLAAPLLLLCACGKDEPDDVGPNVTEKIVTPAARASIRLGSVDLSKPIRGIGTEPYWILDIAPGDISYTDFGVADPQPAPWYPVAPVVSGRGASYKTQTAKGEPVTIALMLEPCTGTGESEHEEPLAIDLTIGSKTYHGCAGPKPAEPVETDNAADLAPNASAP